MFKKFLMILAFLVVGSAVTSLDAAAPKRQESVFFNPGIFNAEYHSQVWLNKAYDSVTASKKRKFAQAIPFKDLDLNSIAYMFLAALMAGLLLMFTAYGLLIAPLAVGALYGHYIKSWRHGLGTSLGYCAGFITSFIGINFLTEHSQIIHGSEVFHLIFSVFFYVFVALMSAALFGLVDLRLERFFVACSVDCWLSYISMTGYGVLAACAVVTQQNNVLVNLATYTQKITSNGLDVVFLGGFAVGLALITFAWLAVVGFFFKESLLNLWVSDVMRYLGWGMLYRSAVVVRPYTYYWQYLLILALIFGAAGVYLWLSARLDVTFLYLNEFNRVRDNETFLHRFSGFSFFDIRTFIKRLAAIIALILMGHFALKSYLFYNHVTLKQAIIRTIMSL